MRCLQSSRTVATSGRRYLPCGLRVVFSRRSLAQAVAGDSWAWRIDREVAAPAGARVDLVLRPEGGGASTTIRGDHAWILGRARDLVRALHESDMELKLKEELGVNAR